MNSSLVAGAAFLAGIAIAGPLLAGSTLDSEPQIAQAGPEQHGPGGGAWERGDRGAMGEHHGWMRDRMMHRMMLLPPRQRCEERLARRAGIVAYTVAKLNLTPEQKPLSD